MSFPWQDSWSPPPPPPGMMPPPPGMMPFPGMMPYPGFQPGWETESVSTERSWFGAKGYSKRAAALAARERQERGSERSLYQSQGRAYEDWHRKAPPIQAQHGVDGTTLRDPTVFENSRARYGIVPPGGAVGLSPSGRRPAVARRMRGERQFTDFADGDEAGLALAVDAPKSHQERIETGFAAGVPSASTAAGVGGQLALGIGCVPQTDAAKVRIHGGNPNVDLKKRRDKEIGSLANTVPAVPAPNNKDAADYAKHKKQNLAAALARVGYSETLDGRPPWLPEIGDAKVMNEKTAQFRNALANTKWGKLKGLQRMGALDMSHRRKKADRDVFFGAVQHTQKGLHDGEFAHHRKSHAMTDGRMVNERRNGDVLPTVNDPTPTYGKAAAVWDDVKDLRSARQMMRAPDNKTEIDRRKHLRVDIMSGAKTARDEMARLKKERDSYAGDFTKKSTDIQLYHHPKSDIVDMAIRAHDLVVLSGSPYALRPEGKPGEKPAAGGRCTGGPVGGDFRRRSDHSDLLPGSWNQQFQRTQREEDASGINAGVSTGDFAKVPYSPQIEKQLRSHGRRRFTPGIMPQDAKRPYEPPTFDFCTSGYGPVL